MTHSYLLMPAFVLGGVCGLRSMTGPALVCWAAYLGWLHLAGTRLGFLASAISVAVFTLFALGELVADKMSFIPSRVSVGPLIARIISGMVCGWALSISASQPPVPAAMLGGAGAVAGAFVGYHLRRFLTHEKRLPDLAIALVEDIGAIAIGFSVIGFFHGANI